MVADISTISTAVSKREANWGKGNRYLFCFAAWAFAADSMPFAMMAHTGGYVEKKFDILPAYQWISGPHYISIKIF